MDTDKVAREFTGSKARIVNLRGKNKLNGVLVELDHWDADNQMYECRLEKTKAMIKLDLNNLLQIDPDDEAKTIDTKDSPSEIILQGDGMTRIIGSQSYQQTEAGIWRKVDAYGDFF